MDIVGAVQSGKRGLGWTSWKSWSDSSSQERRKMVVDELKAAAEEDRRAAAVQQPQQGAWTRWDDVVVRRLTWADLWKIEQVRIGFLIRSVYDVLPSPTNLVRWKLAEIPNCNLCSKRGTLHHILSS